MAAPTAGPRAGAARGPPTAEPGPQPGSAAHRGRATGPRAPNRFPSPGRHREGGNPLITNMFHANTRPPRSAVRLVVPLATMVLLLGCGSSAGSSTPSGPVAGTPAATSVASTGGDQTEPSEPAATSGDGGAGASSDAGGGNGPIGGDLGDRSKGSIQANVSGGLTASIDLPFAPAVARLLTDGPKTGYLPFTDPANGTIFLTVTDAGLLVQYAGPDQVGL